MVNFSVPIAMLLDFQNMWKYKCTKDPKPGMFGLSLAILIKNFEDSIIETFGSNNLLVISL